MFRSLDDGYTSPAKELSNFTNRVDELALFQHHLTSSAENTLPILMFYGVGGTGKTWLLRHFRSQLQEIPNAYLDLDHRFGGNSYRSDHARALAEIRRQFGPAVSCPRFDLAYTWMRFHEGSNEEPLFKGSGVLNNLWELLVEAGSTAIESVPGSNFLIWLMNKVTFPLQTWLRGSSIGEMLTTHSGQQDFVRLKNQLPGEILSQLNDRLLQDLRENPPAKDGNVCRAVVLIDTIESLKEYRASDEKIAENYQWIKDIYHPESGLFVVLAGRDRLSWGDDPDSAFASEQHLQQYFVGGLSKDDATLFIQKCGITNSDLQQAILQNSLDEETMHESECSEPAYHSFSLGLAVDTCQNLLGQGVDIDSNNFKLPSQSIRERANLFLRSMGGDGAYALWLKKLALTTQFDEKAARECFSGVANIEQQSAWRSLLRYSFVRETITDNWFTFHARMRSSLEEAQRLRDSFEWREEHEWWLSYWSDRSTSKYCPSAARAWYHKWCTRPEDALTEWKSLAESARNDLRMIEHFSLLEWWAPCALDTRSISAELALVSASAQSALGIEFWKATAGESGSNLKRAIACYNDALNIYTYEEHPQKWGNIHNDLGNAYRSLPTGNRAWNLRKSIEYYEAALKVRTEEMSPRAWAITQNNLANVYVDLPFGDRDANVRKSISLSEAALRIRTEESYPEGWAMTQNNLGWAYRNLRSGDIEANIRKAIACYEAALRVHTEKTFPRDWAMIQNNLGSAYRNLGGGNNESNIRKAIECYEASLRVRSEESMPKAWGIVQNNLGSAYRNLGGGNNESNIRKAIECYEASLRVRREDTYPIGWAMTQNNLGTAYRNLHTGDREAKLRQAIMHYKAALRVRTKETLPAGWAMTQSSIARAFVLLETGDREANLCSAIECYESAIEFYSKDSDYSEELNKARAGLAEIRNQPNIGPELT